VVNLGYVVNVVEDVVERARVLQEAWSYTKRVLVVSARLTAEGYCETEKQYEDGYLTRTGTFQKLFEQHELRQWIEATLNETCVAAAPGVFYVFRDSDLRYAYVSSHVRRARAAPRQCRSDAIFEANKALFEDLIAFVSSRGRLPSEEELPSAGILAEKVGSVRQAFAIVRRVTGQGQWESIQAERAQDLLVYLALARFSKRPRFSVLPISLKLDLRAFFKNYGRACELLIPA
jgi:DNA phosphorothioation-associated putative methyltransferase